jgi:ABC-type antimicrobial peptide transport system permease subunit
MGTRKSGINLAIFSETFSSFGYSALIYPTLAARQFFIMMALVIFAALVSALFPARRALSLNPADAVRK